MTTVNARNLRADAARNFQRIVDAADRVFSRRGSNGSFAGAAPRIVAAAGRGFSRRGSKGSCEEIAAEARLGMATVYPRFPTRQALVKAVLDQHFTEVMLPELER